ncbi:VWA domain-containing protein [bacterium]|nr:VWA domain-containing protein [bacterium]
MNWPGFSAIANAWWLLLLIPLIIFYFLKLRRPRVEIASLALWQSVVNDQRVNSPFQKFRRNILLWLQMALLILLVLAAMQPFFVGGSARSRYLPVLIDCSASMAATDAETGKSRLDLAKQRVREVVENLLPDQRVSLIAMHSTAQRLTEFTDNKRILLDALDQLKIRDLPSRLEDALRMTQVLARTVPVESVLVYSDGNFPQRVSFDLPFEINYQQLPPAGPNAGITAFNARQTEPPKWDVFLRVESSAALAGTVSLWQDGQKLGNATFVLDAGQSQRITFDVESDVSSRLEAKLEVDDGGYDSLTADNVAFLDLPTARPLRAYVDPELTSYQHALQGAQNVEMFPSNGSAGNGDVRTAAYDLVISSKLDGRSIDAVTRLFIGVIPEDVAPLIVMPVLTGLTEFIDWDRSSALLQHMQLRDVQISEDVTKQPGVEDANFEAAGYSILAHGNNGPLLLERRTGATVEYFLLFQTENSTLPYRVAFPIFVSNAVQIARQEAGISEVRASKTSVLPPREVAADTEYRIVTPSGESEAVRSGKDGILNGVAAFESGRYRIMDGGSEVVSIAVSLLDPLETSLASVEQIQFDELSVKAADELLDTDRPLWSTLAAIAFAVLLVEWWFFQRPAVG